MEQMSTEQYSQKIISLTDQVLIDFASDTFNHKTEWYLRHLPKWRAYSLAQLGAKFGVISPDWMAAFEQEVKALKGHQLRQIEDPYKMTLTSEYTLGDG